MAAYFGRLPILSGLGVLLPCSLYSRMKTAVACFALMMATLVIIVWFEDLFFPYILLLIWPLILLLHILVLKGIPKDREETEAVRPAAVVGNQVLYEGDVKNGVTVVKITKEQVQFEKNGRLWTQEVQSPPPNHWR